MAEIDWSKGVMTNTQNADSTDWDKGVMSPPEKPKTKLGDLGRSLKSGVEQLPGIATGLAPDVGAVLMRPVVNRVTPVTSKRCATVRISLICRAGA